MPGVGLRDAGRLARLLLVGAVLVGCGEGGGAGLPGERARGGGFELRCDPGCGPEAEALLEALGGVRDSVATWFGADPEALATSMGRGRPARVRLHASPASFARADRRLASGRFAEQRAFSHARSRSAHILAEGAPDPARWREVGPGFQGERLVVHEGAHLAVYSLVRDPRWPDWVSEGVAVHAEEGWAAARGAGPAVEPWLQTQRHLRFRLLEEGSLPSVAALVRGEGRGLPLGTRYALWGRLFGVLLEPPFRERTRAFLGELAGDPPPGGWSQGAVASRFHARFPDEEVALLDHVLRTRIAAEGGGAQGARWAEIRRSSGWTREGGLLQVPVGSDPLVWVDRGWPGEEASATPPEGPGGSAAGGLDPASASGQSTFSVRVEGRAHTRGEVILAVTDLGADPVPDVGADPRSAAGVEEGAAEPRPGGGAGAGAAARGLGVRVVANPLRSGAPAPVLVRVPLDTGAPPNGDPSLPSPTLSRRGGAASGPPLLTLEAGPGWIRLLADGAEVASWALPDFRPGAGWGVGAAGVEAVIWESLRGG